MAAPTDPPRPSLSERALASVTPPYLQALNPEQRRAVETLDGPVLVLAGAGTGKTRVLTTRIAHILATRSAQPWEVLAVTFTNKAAREMRERIGGLIGSVVEGMAWLGTFHAIGVKILRRHAELVGLRSDFTILDTDDQVRLMRQVIVAADIDEKRWPAKGLAARVDNWKNRGLSPGDVPAGGDDFANGRGVELYAAYQERLKTLNAVDFGDLLLHCLKIFRIHPDVLAEYHRRFRYILVDEYQDTNVAQYLWLRLLAQGSRNVCCVGDDDQCLVAGTLVTMHDGRQRPIEQVEPGDRVLSAYGSGDFRPAKVTQVFRRQRTGTGVEITTSSGRSLVSTPEHVHFAGYRLGIVPQTYFVYLMRKHGFGFRVGTTQVYTKGQQKPMVGFAQRLLHERGDELWVLATHASENEARAQEYILSLTYRIPTLPFVARKGASINGLVHDPVYLRKIFDSFDTESSARQLLDDLGLSIEHPHHRPRSRNSSRRNVVITLCGDRRGRTPMHRISIVGNDPEGRADLEALGFSVRVAKSGCDSWRFETANSNYAVIAGAVETMRTRFPVNVTRVARLGGQTAELTEGNSLPFTPAGSVMPGMALFDETGRYDIVASVKKVLIEGDVHDINIEHTHNFIANGIVTHNSIYGWRGAEVDNILRFERDFPGAAVIRLEENYRSTSNILATASHLIAFNESRLGKTLHTTGESGDKVVVRGAWDSEEEARMVCEEIEQLQRQGHRLNEMAILVRASFQMREFEDRFITLGLNYRVIGGLRFYERGEIRDALAYFRIVTQPSHDLAFERIVNVPRRGLGEATLQVLHDQARRAQVPLTTAARMLIETDELKPKPRKAIADLLRDFERWRGAIDSMPHTEVAELILEESGYTEMWRKDRSADAPGRLENLKELIRSMEEFQNFAGFLEHIALVMDVEGAAGEDAVSIMTLHGAKGLEFDSVFLPGWEEQLFPHPRSLDESGRAGLEEERRLAYVGLTRARQRAQVSFAANRRIHGLWQTTAPSRFVDELPAENVTVEDGRSVFGGPGGYGASRFDVGRVFEGGTYATPGWKRAQANLSKDEDDPHPSPSPRRQPPTIEGELVARSTGAPSPWRVGDRAFHLKFGPGTVKQVEGNKLLIAFDNAGPKRVLETYVERA